ncbi:hypothetical protein [Paenibacillus sp. AR247]|uniref:hypothetical protein n=1 Tax=Paenibacillus sp. AR247 TaxID=1631599 RepID=UPI002157EA60|nr:hypothetical protein [Paenibacillus sp. AR247]
MRSKMNGNARSILTVNANESTGIGREPYALTGKRTVWSWPGKAAALILGTALLLTACGQGEGGTAGGSDASAKPAGTVQSADTAEASGSETPEALYEQAKKEGKVIVYSTSGLPTTLRRRS